MNLYVYRSNPLFDVDVRGLGEEGDPNCPRNKDGLTPEEAAALKAALVDIDTAMDLSGTQKPPNSPIFKRWVLEGGQVHVNGDGSVTYVRADGVSVQYVNGYPDFRPHLDHPTGVTQVNIQQTTNRSADFRAANIAAGHPEWGNGSSARLYVASP